MKQIEFIKDKESLKYYILALISVFCVYIMKLTEFLAPLYKKIYYGFVVDILINVTNLILWVIMFLTMFFVCRKLHINIFTNKPKEERKELSLKRLILLYALAILPMLGVSIYLNFTLKIVFDMGSRVTILGLWTNVTNMLSWGARLLFIVMFINFMHMGLEKNIRFKSELLNKYFPFGAILSFLVFGLIDLFVLEMTIPYFYLILSFYYGIIYLASDRKFASTYIICYLIWLL